MAPGIFTPGLENYGFGFRFTSYAKLCLISAVSILALGLTGVPQGLERKNEYIHINTQITTFKVKN
jgi:hypothetical protein